MKSLRFPWDKVVLIIIGFAIGDAINHAVEAYFGSPLSPHRLPIGVTGNWVAAAAEVVFIFLLFRVHAYLERRRLGGRDA